MVVRGTEQVMQRSSSLQFVEVGGKPVTPLDMNCRSSPLATAGDTDLQAEITAVVYARDKRRLPTGKEIKTLLQARSYTQLISL